MEKFKILKRFVILENAEKIIELSKISINTAEECICRINKHKELWSHNTVWNKVWFDGEYSRLV